MKIKRTPMGFGKRRRNFGRIFIGRVGKLYEIYPGKSNWQRIHLYKYFNTYVVSCCGYARYKFKNYNERKTMSASYRKVEYLKTYSIQGLLKASQYKTCKMCFNTQYSKWKHINKPVRWNQEYAEQQNADNIRATAEESR